MADRNPQRSPYVLLARRATMHLDEAQVDALAALPWADAVTMLLESPVDTNVTGPLPESDDVILWWTERMVASGAGIQDRMAFFWHNLLTTNRWATGYQQLVGPQLNLLRANALGNFRTLLHAFANDAALMRYLSLDASTAERPNENLARELMELFTTGIGHYSEQDVRAAALAMTGWRLDETTYAPFLDQELANTEPVNFLGETKQWNLDSIVDRLCDHPATAARIAAKIWYHLVGTELSADRSGELGQWWQASKLEIKPLLNRIFNDPEFRAEHYRRPRSGFEYYLALQAVTGSKLKDLWIPRYLGQALYEPPNVAGWPSGERWLDADSLLRRSGLVFGLDIGSKESGLMGASVDEILDRCALSVVGDATINAIADAGAGRQLDEQSLAQLRWRIALTSPEFQLT
jgi:uncharacterized protein (DUF1800 family)